MLPKKDLLEECGECMRLMKMYANSINEHLSAVRKSQAAAEAQNRPALTDSERRENNALQRRSRIRRMLMEHEMQHLIHDLELRQMHMPSM